LIKPAVAGNSELNDHIQRTLAQGVHGSPPPSADATFAHLHVPTTEFTFTEGLWTPDDASGASLTLSITGTPRYVKWGNLVWASAMVTYPTTADASANKIGGLPFTIENNNSVCGGGSIGYHNLLTDSILFGLLNTKHMRVRKVSSDNPYTNAELSQKTVAFSIMYIIA
jgi:hypothetical protein